MGSLTLYKDNDEIDVEVNAESLSGEPEPERTSRDSINGQRRSHELYPREVYSFQTSHMTPSEVEDLEDFLIEHSNIVECEGIFEGTFDVFVEDSEYVAFFKDGEIYPNGQVMSMRAVEVPTDKM